jgi:hypothetical protein
VSLVARHRLPRCDVASRVDYKFLSKKRSLTERSTRILAYYSYGARELGDVWDEPALVGKADQKNLTRVDFDAIIGGAVAVQGLNQIFNKMIDETRQLLDGKILIDFQDSILKSCCRV